MARNIKARRKLSDLYATGVEVRFDAQGGHVGPFTEPIADEDLAVWVQAPSPLQREQAMRDANAARAKSSLRVRRKDEESEEYLTAQVFVSEMSNDTLIEYLLEYDAEKRQAEAMRDVLSKDEWKDFSSLQDAMRKYEEEPPEGEDPDYDALMEADDRFGDQVDERTTEITDADRQSLKMLSRETLETRAMEKRVELIGAQVFMQEYQRQMCFYAVRDIEDHGVLYFESAREWADQPDQIQNAITEALTKFIGEATEAKNVPGAADGSDQSALPSEPETSESSIPEALSV